MTVSTLTPLKAKILLFCSGALALLVAGLFISNWLRGNTIDEQAETISAQKVTINGYEEAERKRKGSEDISQSTSVNIANGIRIAGEQQGAVDQQTEQQVEDIRKEFATKEPTEANQAERQAKISKARIDGLWTSYCVAVPSAPDCAKK